MARRISRRDAIKGGSLAMVSTALWSCSRDQAATGVPATASGNPDFGPFAPEAGSLITDPARFPGTFNEPPVLAEQVSRGALDPVAQRIGQDPLVIEPLHEIGRYGGTLRRAFVGPGDQWGIVRVASGPDSFLRWDKDWQSVLPNIARDFRLGDDHRTLTLFLRRGMRWSDGAPFTAADIMFWYEDLYLDRRIVSAPSPSLRIDNQDIRIEMVDEYTVRFVSPLPYEVLAEFLASSTDLSLIHI